MESFESFVEQFKKFRKEKNDTILTTILEKGSSFFQNLSTNEIDFLLSLFLSDKTGLLNFLGNVSDESMERSIIKGFNLLNFIIEQFYWSLDRYVVEIKKVCQDAIIKRCSHYVKEPAAKCFESLVKLCPGYQLELDKTVQQFMNIFHLCDDLERSKYFKAIGSVAKYHPEAISYNQSRIIIKRVLSDFKQSYSKNKKRNSPTRQIAIYLQVLDKLMHNFSHNGSQHESEEHFTEIYPYVKELSNIGLSEKNKFVSRAAIMLLGNHMQSFSSHVHKDATFWHDVLFKWTKFIGDNGVVAFDTLSAYYQIMGVILESSNTASDRQLFEQLKKYFEENFLNDDVDSTTLQLSIRGFGYMAGACKNYLTEAEVVKMFSLIARRTTTINSGTDISLENIAYYQVALSEILLHLSVVSSDQLTALSTLCLILIKRFPELTITSHSLAVNSLAKTIFNTRKACGRSYEEFVKKLVYEGIIWSCSHMLYVDAEREMEFSDKLPICFKNYLPLWCPLTDRDKMSKIVGDFTIPVLIFDQTIETCIKLIKKLNLDVKTSDASHDSEMFDIPIAVNDTDFKVFVNLVDLFVAILQKIEPNLMDSKTNRFLCEIITESNKNPLISGFYKLVHVVLKLYNSSLDTREEKLLDETSKLLSKYLSDTVDRLSSFSGELQIACFDMIFETPAAMAENMLEDLASVFKTAFSLGQTDFYIAQSALNTLEKWTKIMSGERVNNYLIEIIPSLESFLHSDKSIIDSTPGDIPNKRKVVKNIILSDHEKSMEEFQRRILLFFGSLNSEVTSNFVVRKSCDSGTLEDEKNLLKYVLLYRDIKPEIYLDIILPRTIELALESTDRQTRVVAGEVLHSVVIVMLGRTMQYLSSNPDRHLPLFKKIFPALLRLGSDSDQVIQQIFYPLSIQLTHWYSSKVMLRSSETAHLIEVLFDLLTYESNAALNDFCGVCLAEFVKWSIKQLTESDLQAPRTNIAVIINKIRNYALHPSTQKRIGAAIAFNYLYAILREIDMIIDMFWLELFYCFMKSLDGCNSVEILKSLKHIERVIASKYELLNNPSTRRRKPKEFREAKLKDSVEWLLVQCGSLDCNCRSRSMEFVETISAHVPGLGSVEKVFADYINRNSVRDLNDIILKGLYPKIEILSVESTKPLLRTLDCYIWILEKNLVSLDLLLTDKNANKDMIFNCVVNFIYLVNVKKEGNDKFSANAKQYQHLCELKCKIILRIFHFFKILLDKMEKETETNSFIYIPTFVWNGELFSFISTLIFKPQLIGFDLQNLDVTESLPSSLQQLLEALMQKLNDKHLRSLRDSILEEITAKSKDFIDFDRIFKLETNIELKNYLKGLILLETFDKIPKLYERPLNANDSANKVIQIFNLLKKKQYGEEVSVDLASNDREYFEYLLEFLFLKVDAKMIKTLLDIFISKTELTGRNSTTKISHGEYFMKLFSSAIFRSLLINLNTTLDLLLCNSLQDNFEAVVSILEDALSYVKKNKNHFQSIIPNLEKEFVNRFPTLHGLINWIEKRKQRVINLYSLLVQVSLNPSNICSEPNELYSWIMGELLGYLDLEYKTRMLNIFLPCIVDDTAHKSKAIKQCLNKLKTDYYPTKIAALQKGSLKHSNIIASFQTLLQYLPTLKCVAFFDCVVKLSIGNVKYLWDDDSTKYLTTYFDRISTDDSQESLKILYKYFMEAEDYATRLEIADTLLIRCIHRCKVDVIQHFFEENINEIYKTISQDLDVGETDLKNLIVSKIGCYNCLGIMFAKVPLEKISGADSKIQNNAVGKTETGKGLYQMINMNVLNVRKLKSDDKAPKELMRQLHCAAYNCSISIVSLKCEERFYVLPFAEDESKGQLIWKNIIDVDRRYEFQQDFKVIPKEYKKLINIRSQSGLNRQTQSSANVQSYNLVASTLNDDLACIDLYECNLKYDSIGQSIDKEEEVMSLSFEPDDINNHECTAPICGLIMHMVSKNIFNLPNDGEDVAMPKWMKYFQLSLNKTTIYNIKLFMINIIVNMQNVFKPYGEHFLNAMLNFLNLHFCKYRQMNYVIKDVIVMLINWHGVAVPIKQMDKQLAQSLVEMLIKSGDSNQRHIYKDNVKIISELIEAWQTSLELPKEILKIKTASPKFIVRVILIFLLNGKQESISSERDILTYLMPIIDNADEEIVMHVSNAFGLILEFLKSKNEQETKEWILDNIRRMVIDKKDKDHNRYVKCIYEIHTYYPNIVNHCFQQLTQNYFKVNDINKEKCLHLFLSALPNFAERDILTELGFIKLNDILLHKITACQLIALKIIKKLSDILGASDYLPFVRLTVPYSEDASATQREIVFDIFIAIYKKYNQSIEDNIAVSELRDLSRHILLLGLLDTNEELKNKMLDFWTEDGNMPDESSERILQILDMYDAELEARYLPILPTMMLHLVSKDPEFKKKMFEPLSNCKFEDYKVAIQWRSKHARLAAPLFTSSLATQMSQYYLNSNPTFSRFNQSLNQSLFLRATQSLQFKPTVPQDQSFLQLPYNATASQSSDSTVEQIPQPSRNNKSERLLRNKADLREDIRQNQISANIRRDEMLKEKEDRQRNNIQIYRSYRIGDFPDTEIPHSNLIKPLQELVKHDQIIARDLTVAMYRAMLKEMSEDKREVFFQKLSASVKLILDKTQGSKPLIATVLEIILNSDNIILNPNLIAKVSKSSGLLTLGALLLEEKMISGCTTANIEPPTKIPRCSSHNQIYNKENDWLQLANIYKSMNDLDVVQSILGCEKFGKDLKEATFAQAASEWVSAKMSYDKACELSEGLVKDYCQESTYICLANISDWKQINNCIESDLLGDYDALWEKPMNENWMIPWVLQSQIHGMVENYCGVEFLKALNSWVGTSDKLNQLKTFYGEEMAIFYMDQKPLLSENYLTSGLDKIRKEWKHMDPLYYEQSINKYSKLRGMSDIKNYLKAIKDADRLVTNINNIIKFWDSNVPANQDNLLLWDKHISYRLYFFKLFKQLYEDEEFNETIDTINAAVVNQSLNVARAAFAQNNLHFMKKYLRYSEEYCENLNSNLNEKWRLLFAKYKYLCHLDLKDDDKKIQAYIYSWEETHLLVSKDCSDIGIQIDVKQHIGTLAIQLQRLLIKSEQISTSLSEDPKILQYLPSRQNQENVLKQLSDYCLNNLKECYELADAKNKASCYLKVSKYCHSMNAASEFSLDLSHEFVNSTLNAMRYGSIEASQYFPCLLNLNYSNDTELGKIFESSIKNIETWMFIKWQAQLLSHIDTQISPLIIPILFRLAETYPNSFIYAFRMTKEMNKSLSTYPTVCKLTEILSENKDLESFLEAMKYIVEPELYLKYHVNELEANNTQDLIDAVDKLLTTVYPSVKNSNRLLVRGEIYKDIARFEERIKEIRLKEINELSLCKEQIKYDLDKLLEHRSRNELMLDKYSPWLSKFRGDNIEVPGQYVGDRKPLPLYHTKIVGLDRRVTILPSQRRPIKLTMLGNNGKNYNFLIKFGEDLRTDERIEQLFMLMNKILQGDAVCRQRQLHIDTYLVIPLSASLGLIQWIDNTRSLNDIINSTITEDQKNERSKIVNLYKNWLSSSSSRQTIEAMYKKSLLRYGRQEVTAKFDFLKKKIKWDLLRNGLKKLSSSSEDFFVLRHNFITSYATICVAQWILGIGDRNLSNTLISYASGKALGIDFGYSFDAAIDLSVPELMPFRLTPQILGLLQPFDENGLLKVTMINVLRAIKLDKDPLLACMDIFIQEPSLDWSARKKIISEDGREEILDVKWYPKNKINIVLQKLNGAKPSELSLQQMKERYESTEYFSKYIDIVNGSDNNLPSTRRSKHCNENLSVEKQVECLLDQATDPNILGRTWYGWEPWI